MTFNLRSFADLANKSNPSSNEDLQEAVLATCCQCGEALLIREIPLSMAGPETKTIRITSDCSCKKAERKAQQREEMLQLRISLCVRSNRLVGKHRTMTFENIERIHGLDPAVAAAKRFVENVAANKPTQGLILSGEFGCGKTHIACAVINTLVLQAKKCQFWACFDILETIKASFDVPDAPNPVDAIADVPILVVDDLGNERIASDQRGDWAREQIYRIAYNRDIKQLPTVITTNLTRSEFKARLGGATTSRLLSACRWIDIKAPDYRLQHRQAG